MYGYEYVEQICVDKKPIARLENNSNLLRLFQVLTLHEFKQNSINVIPLKSDPDHAKNNKK